MNIKKDQVLCVIYFALFVLSISVIIIAGLCWVSMTIPNDILHKCDGISNDNNTKNVTNFIMCIGSVKGKSVPYLCEFK